MKKAILGKKIGMTQLFMSDGTVYPVTLIQAGPCTVIQKKSLENDGYEAIQVAYEDIADRKLNKPLKGHFEKAGQKPKRYIKELRLEDNSTYSVGQEINADVFAEGEFVDVTGTSKGKGFAGSIKRWGFSRGPMAHGSNFHRAPGSLGSIAAARVFKGRKLPGRMGADRVTVQGLKILKVDAEKNVLAVKGAIPGNKNGLVIVKNTVKVDKK